jgi:cytoskeletal protein RodZ
MAGERSVGGFGGKLRDARERRGISLRQIANATKISIAALEALERNDISRLPGGIFSRAFVRSYAVEVGANADEVVAKFVTELEAAIPAAAETASPDVTDDDIAFLERQRRASLFLRVALVVLALMIVGAFVAWRLTRAGSALPSAQLTPLVSAPLLLS